MARMLLTRLQTLGRLPSCTGTIHFTYLQQLQGLLTLHTLLESS